LTVIEKSQTKGKRELKFLRVRASAKLTREAMRGEFDGEEF